jgi:hypothetical protein
MSIDTKLRLHNFASRPTINFGTEICIFKKIVPEVRVSLSACFQTATKLHWFRPIRKQDTDSGERFEVTNVLKIWIPTKLEKS